MVIRLSRPQPKRWTPTILRANFNRSSHSEVIMNIKQFKPAVKGKSDKFSWQLYRWAKKNPHALRIWSATWNSVRGVDPDHRQLYIGYKRDGNWIHARQLRNLCSYGARLDCFAYNRGHDTENWIDVTGWFWREYLRKGVCAIHGDRVHDFIKINRNSRKCKHCGEHQTRTVITSKIIKRFENWG